VAAARRIPTCKGEAGESASSASAIVRDNLELIIRLD